MLYEDFRRIVVRQPGTQRVRFFLQQRIQGAASFGWPQRGKTPGNHDGGAKGTVLQVFGLRPGISRPDGMPAVSEQLLFGSQNDDSDL